MDPRAVSRGCGLPKLARSPHPRTTQQLGHLQPHTGRCDPIAAHTPTARDAHGPQREPHQVGHLAYAGCMGSTSHVRHLSCAYVADAWWFRYLNGSMYCYELRHPAELDAVDAAAADV